MRPLAEGGGGLRRLPGRGAADRGSGGHPAQQIVQVAQEHRADLIVIGHSGHSGVWGRFLGSTAEKVSRHAACSVLLAR